MTKYLLRALQNLEGSEEPVTYDKLTQHLATLCRTAKQQPMHLGDPNRFIFGRTGLEQSVFNGLQACVTKWDDKTRNATFDKGLANGVGLGDRFRLYAPNKARFGLIMAEANHEAEAIVLAVDNLSCVAELIEGLDDTKVPSIGWFARLVWTGNPAVASVRFTTKTKDNSSATERLREAWKTRLTSDPFGPQRFVKLQFPAALDAPAHESAQDEPPTLSILASTEDSTTLQFKDNDMLSLEHVPTVKLDDPDMAPKLLYLIPPLCSYQRLLSLSSIQPNDATKPKFRFTLKKRADMMKGNTNPDVLMYYEMGFQNNSDYPIFVTILNLDAAYGIKQIFPKERTTSTSIRSGDRIQNAIIRIQTPKLLNHVYKDTGSSFKMRDTFKAIVSYKEVAFGHYSQPELSEWDSDEWKGVKVPSREGERPDIVEEVRCAPTGDLPKCWIETRHIYTSKGISSDDAKDDANGEGDGGDGGVLPKAVPPPASHQVT